MNGSAAGRGRSRGRMVVEARSTYEDGVISCVNETAAAAGAKPGMTVAAFVERVAEARRKR